MLALTTIIDEITRIIDRLAAHLTGTSPLTNQEMSELIEMIEEIKIRCNGVTKDTKG